MQPLSWFPPHPLFCFPGAGAGRCRCGRVSQGARESGCRSPGAQEGRAQDTRCLQQRSSEADIKARGRCCRAGEPGPADSPVGTRIPAAPRGREEAGAAPQPSQRSGTAFPSPPGQAGGWSWPPQAPQEPWLDAPSPALLQVPSARSREQTSPQPGAVCACRRGQPSRKSLSAATGRCLEHSRDPFIQPLFFFFPPTSAVPGEPAAKRLPYPSGEAGMCSNPPRLLPQLAPIPSSPTHGRWDTMTKSLSLSRHQVRGPHPLPCLPEHGKSSSAPKTLPAPWVWHRGLPGGGRSQAQRVRAHTRLPPPPHARTHTPSLPR